VRATNFSAHNGYVGSVTLNGKPLARSFIRHDEIMAGGELVFTMQATPNTGWGKAPADRPYTQTAY
jgi:putative alpha-1,2-mannosidase